MSRSAGEPDSVAPRRPGAPDVAPGGGSHGVSARAARASDLPRVWQLVLELAEYERMSTYVSGSEERLGVLLFGGGDSLEARVVEHAGRIVGYALFYTCYSSFRTRRRLWLEDLYVEPPARGTGAGRALMRELARVALERGCDRVDWDVLDWNQLAIDFYERNGAGAVRSEWTQFGMEETALRRLAEGD